MRDNSRDSILFHGCQTKAASALTVRKFPDELRAVLKRYTADKEYTQEEGIVTLIREALERAHYRQDWQPFLAESGNDSSPGTVG